MGIFSSTTSRFPRTFVVFMDIFRKHFTLLKNKYPPAKPGVFHRRVKPFITSVRVTSRKYVLTAAKVLLLATRKTG